MFKNIQDNNDFLDLLLKMLAYLPEKRITAKEALNHPFFGDVRKETEAAEGKTEKEVKKW